MKGQKMENEVFEPVVIETPEKKTMKEIFKEQAFNIGIGVATLGLTAWSYWDSHKRNNRKEERYYDYLEEKTELQREALGAYKDSFDTFESESDQENVKIK